MTPNLRRCFELIALMSGIVASATAAEESKLISRAYQVDVVRIKETLPAALKVAAEGPQSAESLVRKFFSEKGVTFPASTTAKDGPANTNWAEKAIFLNERTGILFVRADRREMEAIELGIAASLAAAPPTVSVEARFAELEVVLPELEGTLPKDWSSYTKRGFSQDVLKQSQFQERIQALETRQGVDLLTGPVITTISGRQARIQVEETGRNPTFQTPPKRQRQSTPAGDMTPGTLR